jgi:DNA (cytosine-5)-methyltransferase 1
MLTVSSFFTGVGMFDLGFVSAGYKIKAQVEIDTFCQRVLHERRNLFYYPAVYGDIRDVGVGRKHELPNTDVFIGGFPCQPFSVAGKRKGAQDNRNLWGEFARCIDEYRPRAVVLENVPAILNPYRNDRYYPSSHQYGFTRLRVGKTRKRPPYAAHVLHDLATMGYVCSWGVISASDCQAPHQRDRWWLVGYTNSIGHSEPRSIKNADQDGKWHIPTRQQQGRTVLYETVTASEDVGDSENSRSVWNSNQCESQKTAQSGRHPNYNGQSVVNASGTGREERDASPFADEQGYITRRPYPVRGYRKTQRRLGRVADGTAYRVDEPLYPAPPGDYQFSYQPSRTTQDAQPHRSSRLKALGNGLMPQIAYLLAMWIKPTLESWVDG